MAVGHGLASASELRAEFAAAGAAGELLLFEDFCGWCAHRHVGASFADSDEEVGLGGIVVSEIEVLTLLVNLV